MDPNTTSAIRDIFVMLAAGVFSALCLAILVVIIKLYGPLRDSLHNAVRTSGNLSVITGDVAGISEETASNIAQTARNAVEISENVKVGTSDLSGVVQSVGQAARGVASAATTVSRIGRFLGRFTPDDSDSADSSTSQSSGLGSSALSRILRGFLGDRRTSRSASASREQKPQS